MAAIYSKLVFPFVQGESQVGTQQYTSPTARQITLAQVAQSIINRFKVWEGPVIPGFKESTPEGCFLKYNQWPEAIFRANSTVPYVKAADLKNYEVHIGKEDGTIRDTDGKSLPNGSYIFVMSLSGQMYVAENDGPLHHSSFLQGRRVMGAGDFEIKDGKIAKITSRSGHYCPQFKETLDVLTVLQNQGVNWKGVDVEIWLRVSGADSVPILTYDITELLDPNNTFIIKENGNLKGCSLIKPKDEKVKICNRPPKSSAGQPHENASAPSPKINISENSTPPPLL